MCVWMYKACALIADGFSCSDIQAVGLFYLFIFNLSAKSEKAVEQLSQLTSGNWWNM